MILGEKDRGPGWSCDIGDPVSNMYGEDNRQRCRLTHPGRQMSHIGACGG